MPSYEKYKNTIRRWQELNHESVLWHNAKHRAKRHGIEFSIALDDIVIPEKCPYLGCKLTHIKGGGRVWTNASLDRKNAEIGYVPGNIQVISDLANRMKQNASTDQLRCFAEGILRQVD